MNNLVVLGATGSIGTQTLEVVQSLNNWNIMALTANTNIELLKKQINKFEPEYAVIMKKNLIRKLEKLIKTKNTKILSGMEGLNYVAALKNTDLVINALVGAAGLRPTISALKADNKVGLANKESLVIGGELINDKYLTGENNILPVDSEHNAIFNLLKNHQKKDVKNIWLTASGGPFYDLPAENFKEVSVSQALNHPNWDMGKKITIDSATLMNKGLEVIEAHWLFDLDYDKIKVIIHPESIIHSLVEFIDNTYQAEIGPSDMKIPIQNVLTYPIIQESDSKTLNLNKLNQLTFKTPDFDKFKLLKLAYQAGRKKGSAPIILNAANEIAVNAFLEKKIKFNQIPESIEKVLNVNMKLKNLTVDKIFEIDSWARDKTREVIKNVYNNN